MTPDQVTAELMQARLLRIPLKASDLETTSRINYSDCAGIGWRFIYIELVNREFFEKERIRRQVLYLCAILCPPDTWLKNMIRIDSAVLLTQKSLCALRRKSVKCFPTPIEELYTELKKTEMLRNAAGPLRCASNKAVWT